VGGGEMEFSIISPFALPICPSFLRCNSFFLAAPCYLQHADASMNAEGAAFLVVSQI
jgi:hypothetical protein